MTVKDPLITRLSGITLLLIFLTFLAVGGPQGVRNDQPFDNDNAAALVTAVAEPVTLRNGTNPNFAPGLCLKAFGSCVIPALFSTTLVSDNQARTSSLRICPTLRNPFYVFITTNAP